MGLAIGVAIVVGLIALAVAAGGVLLLLFVAILLASALEPIVGPIRDRLPLGRGATILVVYVTFFVTVARARLHRRAGGDQPGPGDRRQPARVPRLGPVVGGDAPAGDRSSTIGHRRWSTRSRASSPRPTAPDPDQVVEVGAAAAEAAVWLATLLTIVYFWLVEHARLQRYLLAFVPVERRAGARDAWNEIETRLGLWVRGQLILMGTMGVATGTAYTLLGLPGALLLGLIAALTEAIPIIGPLLGAIPAILVAATVSPELALVVAGVYVVIQLVEGSVLVPLVMRNTIGISPLARAAEPARRRRGGRPRRCVPGGSRSAASIEIVLSRLQARETPVAQDPAAIETPGRGRRDEYERSLPDAGEGRSARADRSGVSRGRRPRSRATAAGAARSGSAAPIRQPRPSPQGRDRRQIDEGRRDRRPRRR